jgi:hypothetical protein
MGVNGDGARFLGLAARSGADYSRTISPGRQSLFADESDVCAALDLAQRPLSSLEVRAISRPSTMHADGLIRALGADVIDALDYSDFEGANIVHDLNEPVPSELHGRYSLVFDGGTSEHVAQFVTATENAMKMVADGGSLAIIVPANQQLGHGFFQVAPEFYFRMLCEENGFEIRLALIRETGVTPRWFVVEDPARVGHRIQLTSLGPMDLFVLARRTGDPGLNSTPQQSDYEDAWERMAAPRAAPRHKKMALRSRALRSAPPSLRARMVGATQLARAIRGSGLTRVRLTDLAAQLDEH